MATFTGTSGSDTISGSKNADVIYGLGGADYLDGKKGDDLIYGGNGADTILGDKGNDILYGDAGNDSLFGENDDDTLDGGLGADSLDGGDGNDIIYYDANDLYLDGGKGTDTLIATSGDDFIDIDDSIFSNKAGDFEIFNLLNGADTFIGDRTDNVDLTVNGGEGDDVLSLWNDGDDLLHGDGGNDQIWGGDGNDSIYGDSGTDYLYGGTGDDYLEGGTDYDVYYYGWDQDKDTIQDNDAGGQNGLVIYWGEQSDGAAPSDVTFSDEGGGVWRIAFDGKNYVEFDIADISDINFYDGPSSGPTYTVYEYERNGAGDGYDAI